jgi:hypothetical protein
MPAPQNVILDAKVNIKVSSASEAEAKQYAELLGMSLSDLYRLALMTGLRSLQRSLFPERFIPQDAWKAMLQSSGINVTPEDREIMMIGLGRGIGQAMLAQGMQLDLEALKPENDTTSQ